jgi:hypothetical protein
MTITVTQIEGFLTLIGLSFILNPLFLLSVNLAILAGAIRIVGSELCTFFVNLLTLLGCDHTNVTL